MTDINKRAEDCGFFSFMEEALTFPPSGKFTAPNISAPGKNVVPFMLHIDSNGDRLRSLGRHHHGCHLRQSLLQHLPFDRCKILLVSAFHVLTVAVLSIFMG